jgi:hypothetical protein
MNNNLQNKTHKLLQFFVKVPLKEVEAEIILKPDLTEMI